MRFKWEHLITFVIGIVIPLNLGFDRNVGSLSLYVYVCNRHFQFAKCFDNETFSSLRRFSLSTCFQISIACFEKYDMRFLPSLQFSQRSTNIFLLDITDWCRGVWQVVLLIIFKIVMLQFSILMTIVLKATENILKTNRWPVILLLFFTRISMAYFRVCLRRIVVFKISFTISIEMKC